MSNCRSTYNELQIDTDDFMIENDENNNYREVTGIIRSIDNRLKDEYGEYLALYESDAIEYCRNTTYADIERELDNLKKLEGDFSISNNDETIEYRLFGKLFTLNKVAEEFASEMPKPYLEQFKSND